MRVVNLFAGPGTGKSTTATALFAELKYRGVNAEYVSEDAKDAAWEKRSKKYFQAQQYIYGRQSWRLERLRDEVDIIVTDCPLLLGLVYMPPDFPMPSLRQTIREDFDRYKNLNIRLIRNKPYNPKGRNQSEDEAKQKDSEILEMLVEQGVDFKTMPFGRTNPEEIINAMPEAWFYDIPKLSK